jgi:hypothetical protein
MKVTSATQLKSRCFFGRQPTGLLSTYLFNNSFAEHLLAIHCSSFLGKFESIARKKEGTPSATLKATMNTQSSKKSITLVKEEVVMADGSTFVPMEVKNSSDVLRASLLMLFKHVSDIHVTLVEIVADKFGLSVDDIHAAVKDDPRWSTMFVNPLITDLTATANEHSVKPSVAKKPRKPRAKKVAAPPPPKPADDEELIFNDDGEIVFD